MTDQNKTLHCIVITRSCPKVSDLYNSRDFGFDSVEIIQEDDGYRLVAQYLETELCNRTFDSISAAREAFEEICFYLTKRDSLKSTPQWTDFFDPYCPRDETVLYIDNHSWILKPENK